jgi:endonuclease YncB( thermonuclease family)
MRGRWGVLGIAAVAAALSLVGSVPAQAQRAAKKAAAAALPCGGEEIAAGTVSRIIDGRTFVLGDGREVRLAGIEIASPAARASDAPGDDTAAQDALAKLIADGQVVLRKAEFASDRYGRLVAYVEAVRSNGRRSVQAELLAAGLARVGDLVGERNCAVELLRRENAARSAKLGLWADPYYEALAADKPAEILARRGRFALVEGEVVSVHPSGATIYVNFGRRWSQDFAVTIRKRNERKFESAGLDVHGLAGRRVRVRGWVEARGGIAGSPWRAPWIEASRPEQIETVDRNDARVAR